ncbi:hypothetical protein SCB71_18465 [Herbiconiux sp. KACC 21604]|uniref:hypothetical protein n=1 Tax=unclassified Herbiconiux TaxID=2618217 RepID=UPI001490EEAC|nr:hypothetical protein [Herbiconiux sp. SALV-R1]QJU55040.1 hypothetical protein HL652_16405 [Herbiconiux sp. SALV-R1]WPO86180.1 hypothetical protein SCB71_18465 [Herbiconiux sp. KACC 21604]
MNDTLDWNAPHTISTGEELAAEVARLGAAADLPAAFDDTSTRAGRELHWEVRSLEAFASNDGVPAGDAPADGAFAPVELPHTAIAPFLHFRSTARELEALGETLNLTVGAADYETWVFVDGVELARHRGYFAPFSARFDRAGRDEVQIDIVTRRAVDEVTWDGTDSAPNTGDAHGKGLGSVCEGLPTAGTGLLAPVRLEALPAIGITDAWCRLRDAAVVVEVELEAGSTTGAGAESAASANAEADATATLHAVLRSASEDTVLAETGTELASAAAAGRHTLTLDASALPEWSPVTPGLFVLEIEVRQAGAVLDRHTQRTGVRRFERLADGSLELGGTPLFVRGTTTIGDLWEPAWSGDRELLLERLLELRALNANVLRVHVSVLPDLFYRCADELGILIYQDAPLQWHCFEPVRDDLDPEVEQVAELLRLVRRHPSVVVLSFPNEMHMWEPFHDSDVEFVTRAAQRVEELGHSLLVVQDHSGPTRPQVTPQSFHEYPGYFDGTSASTFSAIAFEGEGTKAIISEFGAGGAPSWEALQRTARAHRIDETPFPLPASPSEAWHAEPARTHVIGGTMDLLQRAVGRHDDFESTRAASQAHQARVLSRQAGRIRRDRAASNGCIQHYFRQPTDYLYNSWFDLAIVDAAGEPTAAFQALREAYRPVAAELLGVPERVFEGADVRGTLWLYNDLAESVELRAEWTVTRDGAPISAGGGELSRLVEPHTSLDAGAVVFAEGVEPGRHEVELTLHLGGREYTRLRTAFEARAQLTPLDLEVAVLGDVEGFALRTGGWLGDVVPWTAGAATVVVTPGTPLDDETRQTLIERVARGGRLVLLERPAGEDVGWTSPSVSAVIAGDLHTELAHAEFSLLDSGLRTDDLSRWPTHDGRVVTHPVLAADGRQSPGWASTGPRLQYWAVQEFKNRYGSTVVCQAHVWDSVADPAASALLRHLLAKPARVIA